MRRLGFSGPIFVAFVAGCASPPTPPQQMLPPPLSTSSELCRDSDLEDDDFCLPVERVEALLSTPAWGVGQEFRMGFAMRSSS